jgi:hypothetical protein
MDRWIPGRPNRCSCCRTRSRRLAKEDHSKLTTIVVRVFFAVASLAHALLATVCMHAWNLLAQMLHQDPKPIPVFPASRWLGWLAGKKPKDAVMLATWSPLIKTGKRAVSRIRLPGTCLRRWYTLTPRWLLQQTFRARTDSTFFDDFAPPSWCRPSPTRRSREGGGRSHRMDHVKDAESGEHDAGIRREFCRERL